jgi:hypothetical protein
VTRTLIRSSALAFAAGALIASSAPGQPAPEGTVQLTPNTAGKPSTLSFDLNPEEMGTAETPQSVTLFIANGFKFDRRARAERCSDAQAQQVACPPKSRIGTGQAIVNASGFLVPGGSQDFTASIEMFLAAPASPGDLAGVVVQVSEPTTGIRRSGRGRLTRVAEGPFGSALVFDEFPGAVQPPPGVTIDVKRVQLSVGARRRVRKVKKVRKKKKVVRKVRVRRYYLITNPPTCTGSWPFQVRVRFPSGEVVRDGAIGCSA